MDSIDVDKPLPDYLVGNELGQFKLEYKFIEAIFLALKVYGGFYMDKDGSLKEISKIKGFKNKVNLNSLKSLLLRSNKQKSSFK